MIAPPLKSSAPPCPRPRILLLPNNSFWIVAQMCRQIEAALSMEFEFFIAPETLFESRPALWDRVLPEMDLVHCMNESAAGVLAAHGGTKLPVVTWIHHITEWSRDHEQAVEISAAIVACTAGWQQRIAEHAACPVHVVRHGVDGTHFYPRAGARKALGISESDFVVAFFGSRGSDLDHGRKGIGVFLEVVRRCAREIPNLRVLLAGPDWDAGVFEAAAVRLTYLGYLPYEHLPIAYSAADIYLMTATVEGGPCTVLEAMACGTPVAATRVGLVPEVVIDGENGISAGVGDVDGLVKAVCALARDQALSARLSANARATAEALPWPEMLRPLGEVYRSVLPGPVSTAASRRLDSAEFNRTAVAAEAILNLRRVMAAAKRKKTASGLLKHLRGVLAAGDLTTLRRAYRMAARGEV